MLALIYQHVWFSTVNETLHNNNSNNGNNNQTDFYWKIPSWAEKQKSPRKAYLCVSGLWFLNITCVPADL